VALRHRPRTCSPARQLIETIRDKQRQFVGAEEVLRRQRSRRATILNATGDRLRGGALTADCGPDVTLTRGELLALSSTYERHLRAEANQRQQLKESREWFQITLKSLGEAVVSTDHAGNVSFINPVPRSSRNGVRSRTRAATARGPAHLR